MCSACFRPASSIPQTACSQSRHTDEFSTTEFTEDTDLVFRIRQIQLQNHDPVNPKYLAGGRTEGDSAGKDGVLKRDRFNENGK